MTGYSKVVEIRNGVEISVEVKTLNSKYLSISISSPSYLSECEMKMNDVIGDRIKRGKVSVKVYVKFVEPPKISLDFATAQAYHSALEDLASRLGIPEPVGIDDILRFKEILRFDLEDDQVREICEDVVEVLREAVSEVVKERSIEGQKLRKVLEDLLDGIESDVVEISKRSENLLDYYSKALRENVEKIIPDDVIVDKNVLETAIAVLAERADIREEVDRLKSHVERAKELLDEDGSVGPNLDFLAQEMLREFNTILSKSKMADITDRALDGKVLVNSLREQVQNIE